MSQSRWNMVLPDKLEKLPVHSQYFEYAEAYLDSAQRLCATLARSTRKATFQRGAVVLYLVQHALELFYKGAIFRAKPKERLSHGVEKLSARYLALYPGKDFYVRPWFVPSYEGLTKEQTAEVKKRQPPADQLFRYPEDKAGSPWEGLYGFEASSCLREIQALVLEFNRARDKICT